MPVRRPAWVEDDDGGDEDYAPVPTFQSAFTEALGAADWTRSAANSAAQGNAFVQYYSNIIYLVVIWIACSRRSGSGQRQAKIRPEN